MDEAMQCVMLPVRKEFEINLFYPVVQTRKGMAGTGAAGRSGIGCYITDDGLQTYVNASVYFLIQFLSCNLYFIHRSLGRRLHRRRPRLRHRVLLVQTILPEPGLEALRNSFRAAASAQ